VYRRTEQEDLAWEAIKARHRAWLEAVLVARQSYDRAQA
jgi:hypothetical protein